MCFKCLLTWESYRDTNKKGQFIYLKVFIWVYMYVNIDVHKVKCIVCFIFAVPDVHCHIVCILLCFILRWLRLIYANKHQYGIFFEFERDKERGWVSGRKRAMIILKVWISLLSFKKETRRAFLIITFRLLKQSIDSWLIIFCWDSRN